MFIPVVAHKNNMAERGLFVTHSFDCFFFLSFVFILFCFILKKKFGPLFFHYSFSIIFFIYFVFNLIPN